MQKWLYSLLMYSYSSTSGYLGEKTEQSVEFKIFGDETSHKKHSIEKLDEVISWLGLNGWELVSITERSSSSMDTGYSYFDRDFYFKKQIEQQ